MVDVPDMNGVRGSAEGLLRARWPGSGLGGLLLVLLCLAVYLPGFFALPAVDRDESRFAQASRQMLESGDYTVPRIQGRPRLNKPPLIYWAQSTAARLLTHNKPAQDAIWMYRVPSLLAAIAAVLMTWRMGISIARASRPDSAPLTGFLAAAILAACPVMFWEAHQARADMLLVACTTLATWMLWEIWGEGQRDEETKRQRDKAPLNFTEAPTRKLRLSLPPPLRLFLLWAATAAGVLTKGPITPMIIALGALALSITTRRWRWLRGIHPLLGVAIIAAALAPWVYAVSRQVGWDTYISTIKDEVLGRSLEPKEGHGGFPGYHTILLPFLLFPGSLFIGAALWGAAKDWRETWRAGRRPSPAQLRACSPAHDTRSSTFLCCLLLPPWLVLELVGTKLPHYTMPLYPLLAILAASTLCTTGESFSGLLQNKFLFRTLAVWLIALPTTLVFAGMVYAASFAKPISQPPLLKLAVVGVISLLLAAASAAAATIAYRRRNLPGLTLIGLLTFTLATTLVATALPRFNDLWISRSLAEKLNALDPSHSRPIATISRGFQEDSLIFCTRGRIDRITDEEAADWLKSNAHGLLIAPAEERYDHSKYNILGAVEGFNYSKGRATYLSIVEARP